MQETRVVLGIGDRALEEEVLHFLARIPRIRVVAAAGNAEGLARGVAQARPDAAVVSPSVLKAAPELDGASVLVISERETSAALRTAIRAGARGFYVWPQEREALARDAETFVRPRPQERGAPGRVVAVYGPRGGAGVTFLATNLAAALAARDARAVLVDLDHFYADLTTALGVPPGADVPTVSELTPVLEELSPDHLDRVLYAHPRGFRVLLGPHDPKGPCLDPGAVAALAGVLRARWDAAVLHLPRTPDEPTRAALEAADDILLVVTLDVLAFRDARRTLAWLAGLGVGPRCRLVINRAARAEIVPQDAERVFGLSPACVIGVDRSVPRAQNRGELVVGRSGLAARKVQALAEQLFPGDAR